MASRSPLVPTSGSNPTGLKENNKPTLGRGKTLVFVSFLVLFILRRGCQARQGWVQLGTQIMSPNRKLNDEPERAGSVWNVYLGCQTMCPSLGPQRKLDRVNPKPRRAKRPVSGEKAELSEMPNEGHPVVEAVMCGCGLGH